jgi:hypothetical protein
MYGGDAAGSGSFATTATTSAGGVLGRLGWSGAGVRGREAGGDPVQLVDRITDLGSHGALQCGELGHCDAELVAMVLDHRDDFGGESGEFSDIDLVIDCIAQSLISAMDGHGCTQPLFIG